jgi:hypothetical protein
VKFKPGDKVVVFLEDNQIWTDIVLDYDERLNWYMLVNYPVKSRRFREKDIMFEEIYNSTLYQAMKEN